MWKVDEFEIERFLKENKRKSILVDGVPVYEQTDGLCGPSSLRMVSAFHDVYRREDELADITCATPALGCTPLDLVKGAKELGFDAYYHKHTSINQLARLLDKGLPVIVDWFPTELGNGHYSVARGIEEGEVLILDPYKKGERRIPVKDFMKQWWDCNGETPEDSTKFTYREIVVVKPRIETAGREVMSER